MNQTRREATLRVLTEHAPRPLHLGEICSRLGVPKRDREEVLKILDDLVGLRMIAELPGRRYRVTKTGPERRPGFGRGSTAASLPRGITDVVHGRLTQHPRGFGFVAVDEGGPDVFIPPDAIGSALHGDYVAVQAHRTHRGREGRITDLIARGLTRLTGTVLRSGRGTRFEPDDARLRIPIRTVGRIPRNVSPEVAVLAEVVRYPRHENEPLDVRVVDVIGLHGETPVEVEKIKLREGIVAAFPDEVLTEANAFPARPTARDRREREDLRGYDLVTIDPADARDHDDAVWAERLGDGGFRILVAIADVSHYVPEDGALDREAFTRGCSVYLPDQVVPMLPERLSTDLASLVAGRDRLCMTVEIVLGPSGAVRRRRFLEGVMCSRAKLTYAGVARALGLTMQAEPEPEAEKRGDLLRVLHEAARILRRRRLRRGSLDFDLPEAKVLLDAEEVEPLSVERSRKDPGLRQAYQLVEEMMLLANEVVAEELTRRGVPTLYRVHGTPDPEKIDIFAQVAASLGDSIDPEDALEPKKLARFLRKIEGSEQAPILSYLALRAMQQATYDTHNIGHFGLASKDYLHFTSPIRRYPDLVVHRIVRKVIRNEKIDPITFRPQLRKIGAESSRLERRAMTVERDVVDLYRAVLMKDRVGEELEATISGVSEHGIYATLDEPFVDVFLPAERLERDAFRLDDLGIRLLGGRTGKVYELGDRLTVRLEEVKVSDRQVVAAPAHLAPEAGERPSVGRSRRRRGEKKRGRAEEPAQRAGGRRKRSDERGHGRKERSQRGTPADGHEAPRRGRRLGGRKKG